MKSKTLNKLTSSISMLFLNESTTLLDRRLGHSNKNLNIDKCEYQHLNDVLCCFRNAEKLFGLEIIAGFTFDHHCQLQVVVGMVLLLEHQPTSNQLEF